MFKLSLLLLGAALLVAPGMAKRFDRCSLAREMHRLGTPKDQLSRWTCIAHHESNYNTEAVGTINSNGSRDYGIFQINDYYWCRPPSGRFSYDECAIDCNSFLVDSIEPALKCARKVLDQQGWSAWSTWHFCDGRLDSIDDCF